MELGGRRYARGRGSAPRKPNKATSDNQRSARELWNNLLPWPVMSILSAVIAVVAGWMLVASATMLGWTEAMSIPIRSALRLAAQFWFSANFARVDIAGVSLSIAPIGLSVLLFLINIGMAGVAAGHSLPEQPDEDVRWKVSLSIGAVFGLGYALAAAGLARYWEDSATALSVLPGALAVGVLAGVVGAGRAVGWRPSLETWTRALPDWLLALPRSIGAGLAVIALGSCIAFVASLMANRDRFDAIQLALQTTTIGALLLLVAQLLWLPNLLIWGASWVCGAGFGLGPDAWVTPLANQSGVLPSLPVFAVVPPAGEASGWMALWLLFPVAAGALSAWVMLSSLALPPTRPDVTAVIGGLTGLALSVALVGVAALSGGDLGSVHLVGLGPELLSLLLLAPPIMGFAGIIVGVVVGLRSWIGRPAVKPASVEPMDTAPEVATEDD
jgi:hypothetical protein